MTQEADALREAKHLIRAREQLLSDHLGDARGGGHGPRPLDAASLREALVDLHDLWLAELAADLGIRPDSGFALVAVGGLGRRELLPYSDLDLVLLHDTDDPATVAQVADQLWYPIWDAHLKLDHSVRTVDEAITVAAQDIPAAMGMLDARDLAGDAELTDALIGGVRRQWRAQIRDRFDELIAQTELRWARHGEIAHRAEPDIKSGRGGPRDLQLLGALALAHLTDGVPGLGTAADAPLVRAHRNLLDVRTELHRVAGRARDQLRAQDADEIAAALHIGDRFDLARVLSDSARTVSYAVDVGLRTAANALPKRGLGRLRPAGLRRPLDEGVVEQGGEVVLARDARPKRDPALITRVAAVAAQHRLPIGQGALARLAEQAPELREPWPADALSEFLILIGSGDAAVPVIEALDRTGLWGRLLPEWGAVRDLPPRDAVHTWTVDRHLVETAAIASTLTTQVARPDLLVLGALIHDIGKGRGGDHAVVGAELAEAIGHRLGLWPSDVDLLSRLVRHHLLLPHTATRRDLDDPATIAAVVDAIGGDAVLLELLEALAEADSRATGPGVWGEWKATLIAELVRRTRMALAGDPLPTADPVDPAALAQGADGQIHVSLEPSGTAHTARLRVIAPDAPGLLARETGVFALHGLRVLDADLAAVDGSSVNTFIVAPRFGPPPEAGLLRQDLVRARAGELDVFAALAAKDAAARDAEGVAVGSDRPASVPALFALAPPRVLWLEAREPGTVLLEVRAEDRVGLLSRLAAAFEQAGAQIEWAKVSTLGASIVDVFSVRLGEPDSRAARAALEQAILAVLPHVHAGADPTGG